jgi:hypothetical protein
LVQTAEELRGGPGGGPRRMSKEDVQVSEIAKGL